MVFLLRMMVWKLNFKLNQAIRKFNKNFGDNGNVKAENYKKYA